MTEHVGIAEVLFIDDSADDTHRTITKPPLAPTLPVSLQRRRPPECTGSLSGTVADGILTEDRGLRDTGADTMPNRSPTPEP